MDFGQFKQELFNCRQCRQLFGFEPRPVLWGNSTAPIVHISQAPSWRVHLAGKPFDDKSGQHLRHDWYQISDETFYNPDIFYLTNVGHCYPGKNESQGDRKPPKVCAQKWLTRELKFLRPRLFLLVGSYAAAYFFPKRKFTDLVFDNLGINHIPCFVLPHPSPLNIKWFKNNPQFEREKLTQIRAAIKKIVL